MRWSLSPPRRAISMGGIESEVRPLFIEGRGRGVWWGPRRWCISLQCAAEGAAGPFAVVPSDKSAAGCGPC